MHWIQAHLSVDRAQAPMIELLLRSCGAFSVTIKDAGDEPLLEPEIGSHPLWGRCELIGLFPETSDDEYLTQVLKTALSKEPNVEHRVCRLEDRVWREAWKEHYHPMRFGQRLWICPHEHEITKQDAIVVKLDPGLAFGTGSHATTALCLRHLEDLDLQGKRVIDFGCGSGVLGIAALKLGAASVVAIDHDPQALEATQQNAKSNGVEKRIAVQTPKIDIVDPVDLVVSNILARTLIELSDRLAASTRSGGALILSGILEEQETEVIAAYSDKFAITKRASQDGWLLIAGTRNAH